MFKSITGQKIRLAVQIFFVIMVLYLSVGHYLAEDSSIALPLAASIDAVCPFGGIVTMYSFLSSGDFVQKLHQSDVIMIIALLFILIIGGASFCGWICPLGAVQEWFGKLGRRVFKKRYNNFIPGRVDKILRYGKYLVLIILVVNTARSLKLIFQPYDPYYNLFNIWTGNIAISGYIVVTITLLLSLIVERPYCRYACPLGAVNGLFNKISILNISRKESTCINCNKCNQVCPVGINVSESKDIKDSSCIRCLKCEESCPVNTKDKSTLSLRISWLKKWRNRRINKGLYTSIFLTVFLGTIIITSLLSAFSTTRSAVYDSIADIRGSSTIQELLENYPINMGELNKVFAISSDIPIETKLKDISTYLGINEELEYISPEKIREIVEYLDKDIFDFALYINIGNKELVKYLPDNLISLEENGHTGEVQKLTLREYIEAAPVGTVAFLMNDIWPQDIIDVDTINNGTINNDMSNNKSNVDTINQEMNITSSLNSITTDDNTEIQIKGTTTLSEIKEIVEDYNSILRKYQIPEDVNQATMLKDLKDKYSINVKEFKDYIEERRIK